jgi:ABC-type nitrate/sulfonate/bicarbonate transport system permease component
VTGDRVGGMSSRPGETRLTRARTALRSRQAVAVVSFVILLCLWEAFGRANPLFASYPTQIVAAAVSVFVPEILPAFDSTLIGFAVGLAISIPLAQLVGIAMGRNRLFEVIVGPYVNALYVTPRIALIPILVLWFGLDFELRVSIVVLSAVFPMIVNTYTGMKHVDHALLDVGRAFTANGSQRLRTIILPGALPYIFAGLRIGTARALGGVIVAEMTASITGIGRKLIDYGTFFEIDRLFVAVISIGILGLILNRGLAWIQRRTAPWTQAVRAR